MPHCPLTQLAVDALGHVPDGYLVGQSGWTPSGWCRILDGHLFEVHLDLDATHGTTGYHAVVYTADGGRHLGAFPSFLEAQRRCAVVSAYESMDGPAPGAGAADEGPQSAGGDEGPRQPLDSTD